jgi:hypothetical protein
LCWDVWISDQHYMQKEDCELTSFRQGRLHKEEPEEWPWGSQWRADILGRRNSTTTSGLEGKRQMPETSKKRIKCLSFRISSLSSDLDYTTYCVTLGNLKKIYFIVFYIYSYVYTLFGPPPPATPHHRFWAYYLISVS